MSSSWRQLNKSTGVKRDTCAHFLPWEETDKSPAGSQVASRGLIYGPFSTTDVIYIRRERGKSKVSPFQSPPWFINNESPAGAVSHNYPWRSLLMDETKECHYDWIYMFAEWLSTQCTPLTGSRFILVTGRWFIQVLWTTTAPATHTAKTTAATAIATPASTSASPATFSKCNIQSQSSLSLSLSLDPPNSLHQ